MIKVENLEVLEVEQCDLNRIAEEIENIEMRLETMKHSYNLERKVKND